MLEWHIYEDERVEIRLPVERFEQVGFRWSSIMIALLLPMIFGLLLLTRWQLAEGQKAIYEDLTALIQQEERLRSFGLREEAANLLAPDVSDEWKGNYLATLTEPYEAGHLQINEGLFDGEGTLVSVQRGEAQQMRYYRLVEGAWRRAALPAQAWGESALLSTANGIEISYRERDKAFAHTLARDLDALDDLPNWSKQLSLRIEPAELQGAVLVQSIPLSDVGFMRRAKTQIVLNSPLTVHSKLDGEAAVRLALAELIQPIKSSQISPSLLAMPRLKEAAHTVGAIRWALSLEEQGQLHTLWRERAEASRAPSFSATTSRIDPFEPTPKEATALLMADYLYQSTACPHPLTAGASPNFRGGGDLYE